jgi:hypothetical protein
MVASVEEFLRHEATEEQRVAVSNVLDAQLLMGMKPRDDSTLTVQYARGLVDWLYADATDVANDLVAVNFVYEKTLYNEIVRETLREVAEWLRNMYRLSWGDTWQIVRVYAPTMVKLYCVDSCVQSASALSHKPESTAGEGR